jgi:hypothetical protein
MTRPRQYVLPDVDPTIAVAQAARLEGTAAVSVPTRNLPANRLTPLICMSVTLLLIVVGWVVRSPSTTSAVYAFAEKIPANR